MSSPTFSAQDRSVGDRVASRPRSSQQVPKKIFGSEKRFIRPPGENSSPDVLYHQGPPSLLHRDIGRHCSEKGTFSRSRAARTLGSAKPTCPVSYYQDPRDDYAHLFKGKRGTVSTAKRFDESEVVQSSAGAASPGPIFFPRRQDQISGGIISSSKDRFVPTREAAQDSSKIPLSFLEWRKLPEAVRRKTPCPVSKGASARLTLTQQEAARRMGSSRLTMSGSGGMFGEGLESASPGELSLRSDSLPYQAAGQRPASSASPPRSSRKTRCTFGVRTALPPEHSSGDVMTFYDPPIHTQGISIGKAPRVSSLHNPHAADTPGPSHFFRAESVASVMRRAPSASFGRRVRQPRSITPGPGAYLKP